MPAAAVPVGFIGLGLMGKPMAHNLLKHGFAVVVHNRSRGAVDELVAAGASAARSPAEIAQRTTRVITMLPDSPDVEAAALGEGGIAGAARAGAAHGAYCVGCCLPLFAVLLVVGLMNLLWMVAMFLIVLVERNWKHGLAVARAAGVVLIVLGIAMAAWPAVLFVVSGA